MILTFVARQTRTSSVSPPARTIEPTSARVPPSVARSTAPDANRELIDAANQQRSKVQLFATGRVTRLLPDDNEGSRHQKFLIRAASDLTVMVVYNLDLAPRIPAAVGDSVTVRGEYIWNEKGGLLHWTHHDPSRRHQPGWVDLNGTRYQ